MAGSDSLSLLFSALADPTRRGILLRLSEGAATVSELAEPLPISVPAVSRHLKVLEHAGLIDRGRQAQWRTSSLRTERLAEASGWVQELTRVWEGRFDRLDQHLERMKRELADPAPSSKPTPESEEDSDV